MIVFTVVTKQTEDVATVWASSLSNSLKRGEGGIVTWVFHTSDVIPTRFTDFDANAVNIGDLGHLSEDELLATVLDKMKDNDFDDRALYVKPSALFQQPLDELHGCPLDDNIWLAARNENVFFDDKKNGKFYPMYNPDHARKWKLKPDGYLNADVLLFSMRGMYVALKRQRCSGMVEYLTQCREKHQWNLEDCINSIAGEYRNLFDRYNAFAETKLTLDFGDILNRRNAIRHAAIVTYTSGSEPWLATEGDLNIPTIQGTQYPYNHYRDAVAGVVTYISGNFRRAVNANAERYKMISDWEINVADRAGPLKRRLEELADKLDD